MEHDVLVLLSCVPTPPARAPTPRNTSSPANFGEKHEHPAGRVSRRANQERAEGLDAPLARLRLGRVASRGVQSPRRGSASAGNHVRGLHLHRERRASSRPHAQGRARPSTAHHSAPPGAGRNAYYGAKATDLYVSDNIRSLRDLVRRQPGPRAMLHVTIRRRRARRNRAHFGASRTSCLHRRSHSASDASAVLCAPVPLTS